MLIRTLIVLLLLAGAVRAVAAQTQRVDVWEHPEASSEVLWSKPASQQGIYRGDGELFFASRDGMQSVRLDGAVMAVEISESGSRIGVLLKEEPDEPLLLRVFTQDGMPELAYELPHHRDDPRPQFALSDVSKDVVYARPGTAEVCFVRDDERDCVSLFKDAGYTHERNVFVDVSPDGRHVAVAAQREPAHPELSAPDANAQLFLFDRLGNLIWKRPLPQPAVRALALSPENGVAVSTYDAYAAGDVRQWSRLVTLDGETRADAPYGADMFAFGDEEILLITARRVVTLNVSEGTSRLVYSVDSARQIISAAAGGGGANVVLLTGRRIFDDGGFAYEEIRMLHLHETGVVVGEDDVAAPPQRAPRVAVDADGRRTALILDHATQLYTWPR